MLCETNTIFEETFCCLDMQVVSNTSLGVSHPAEAWSNPIVWGDASDKVQKHLWLMLYVLRILP